MTIGFIGLGLMGMPIARRIASAGGDVLAWNRTRARCEMLRRDGARIAESVDGLFAEASIVFVMVSDEAATDAVLGRAGGAFQRRVAGRTIVQTATASPEYSLELGAAIHAAGGSYVEAPVSGSREPAERGELIGMVAGDREEVAQVRDILQPACRETFDCGPVPNASRMKLAVNTFLIATVAGLCEATHFAERHDLDLSTFASILDAGPMSSAVSRSKLRKLLAREFSAQASIADVYKNTRLITQAARGRTIATPLLDACRALFEEARGLGLDDDDMSAVIRAIEQRSRGVQRF